MDIKYNPKYRESVRKQLFAEDLVYSISQKSSTSTIWPYTVNQFRPYVANSFTSTFRKAIWFLVQDTEEVVYECFEKMEARDLLTLKGFEDFVSQYSSQCFEEGFEADLFLNFSARVAYLSVLFYEKDVRKAPHCAAVGIAAAMEKDLTNGGWDILTMIAEKYASDGNVLNLTADTEISLDSEDLESSDDDCVMYVDVNYEDDSEN